jgi:hypothetical protein
MMKQAQEKLTWALDRLGATFQAVIQAREFGEYRIAFREGGKSIPKTVDIRAVDDCVPSGGHIPDELKSLIEQVKLAFGASQSN